MKTLFLIRHAKSSWEAGAATDFDRTLNDRGRKEAPKMAAKLAADQPQIDCFISSPAVRALSTAAFFAAAYKRSFDSIIQVEKLYEPALASFYEVAAAIDDSQASAVIFSHNPGITEFVQSLSIVGIDHMPTCAIVGLTIDCDHWKGFQFAPKHLLFFRYPKM